MVKVGTEFISGNIIFIALQIATFSLCPHTECVRKETDDKSELSSGYKGIDSTIVLPLMFFCNLITSQRTDLPVQPHDAFQGVG